MVNLPRDLRLAVRTLFRKPGVTALAVASLGLAIGFSTAAFSILDAYALRDLPVRDPDRLAVGSVRTRDDHGDIFSWAEYQAIASRARSFSGVAAEDRKGARVKLPDRDDFPIIADVSENYFDVLGVQAAMGDVFHEGRGRDQTLVITDRYWQDALGRDPAVIGRSLPVASGLLRIIGVLPPGFTGANRGLRVDLFVPPQTFFGVLKYASPADLGYTSYEMIARLRPGATRDQARDECDAILRQVERDGLAPAPQRKMSVGEFGEGLWQKLESNASMLAMIVLLVLIAAANLANLRLVENESRRHETGVRLALGAGRADLARQHLAETLLVSAAATLAGLLLARWLISLAPAIFYSKRYIDYGIRLDERVFTFSSATLLAVALIGAAIPLSDAWRRRIVPALHGSRATRSSRWMTALVVTQMALVTGVACSAGLLWRSVQNMAQIRPAMDPDRKLLLVNGWYDLNELDTLPRIATLSEGLARMPGVQSVAWARRVMLSGSGGGAEVEIEVAGQPKRSVPYNQVSPSYFATTGARMLSGRGFTDADSRSATRVILVNALFARRFFNGQDPLGAWVKTQTVERQVVGVVEDGPYHHLSETPRPFVYFPFAQRPVSYFTWMIEARRDPADLAAPVRTFIRGADSAYTLTSMETFSRFMRGARSDHEVAATVSGSMAAVGLMLAAAGLFGVTLFAVARRTPEFGVRVAMGASPARLARQVLRETAIRVIVAFPLGWLLTFAGRRTIAKLLYGVAPDDPWTFTIATSVVAVVALLAALQPALRASRIDPMTALRHE